MTVVDIAQSIRCIDSLLSITNAYDLRSTGSHFNSVNSGGKFLYFSSLFFFFLTTALAATTAHATEKK